MKQVQTVAEVQVGIIICISDSCIVEIVNDARVVREDNKTYKYDGCLSVPHLVLTNTNVQKCQILGMWPMC